MERCEHHQAALEELAVNGRAVSAADQALQSHLAVCSHCRAELARLRLAESGLRNWPRIAPPAHLANRVMSAIIRQPVEEWRLLPLSIWLPALAILCGVCIVLLAAPFSLSIAPLSVELAPQAAVMIGQAQAIEASGQQLFWAVWCGIAAILAGLGIALGLSTARTSIAETPWRDRFAGLRERAH